jgi:hypothetical protein
MTTYRTEYLVTNLFDGSTNELSIYPLSTEETDTGYIVWIEATYTPEEGEPITWRAVYELDTEHNAWTFLDGDSEPDMDDTTRKLWEGEPGDRALSWCLSVVCP